MQTFIRAFVSCICVLTAAMSARAGDSPLEKTFARGVYWPWEATATNAKIAGKNIWEFTDDTMAMLKNEWHVNVIWFVHGAGDAARLCDLAAKHGILVLVATPLEHHIAHGMPSEPELAKTAQAAVAPMRAKPAASAK